MGPSWRLTDEDVLALPLDRLALEVLRDWLETEQWNLYNWLGAAREAIRDNRALKALAEAQNWLVSRGLLVRGAPSQTSSDSAFISRAGERVLAEGFEHLRAAERLSVDLHPRLERVQTQFLIGEYELAAFAAMREVEILVRESAGAEASLLGVKLMRQAFGSDGPLTNPGLEADEQVGLMELFAGAIGVFKNPPSHRQVDYDHPTEAAEVVLLADLLLRILERSLPPPEQA